MTKPKKRMAKESGHPAPVHKNIPIGDLEAIVERSREGALSDEEHGTLKDAIGTLSFLTSAIESKSLTIARLRKMLFGASTEDSNSVLSEVSDEATLKALAGTDLNAMERLLEEAVSFKPSKSKPKKGHGRAPASDYTGAIQVDISHSDLEGGQACPNCFTGRLYVLKAPGVLVRITGMAPLSAKVYNLEKLRCNLCSKIFTASPPPGIGEDKYDEGATAMVALLKYGTGLPFNRIEALQAGLGIPLPSSTQWDIVADGGGSLLPAYQELVRHAARGEVLHNDDTKMKILELTGYRREEAIKAGDIDPCQRVGIFTSGIVSVTKGVEIVLFFTGHQHAGENLSDVLALRAGDLAPPIQMSDALALNTCGDFDTLISNCLVHARRKFVDLAENFPEECSIVIKTFREVYRVDGEARVDGLSPEARLALHQAKSGPLMEELMRWLCVQIDKKIVESNSPLGRAIGYLRKHWSKLTLFLREPGAPLDNNTCERALKKAIINRKNAYFYMSREGARIGDMYMSLIHTAERCGASPFEYLVALLKQPQAVVSAPGDWMPWNYAATLERVTGSAIE